MILRKPLAFLIKNFKLIHFFLVLINIYLIYKTSSVLVFFNEYIRSSNVVLETSVAKTLISPMMFLSIFIMMIGSVLILTILRAKDKPTKFYYINILNYVFTLAVFAYDYTILERIENTLLDVQILELSRDLIMVSIILQNISLVWLGIRAAGFDIKKFHFNENLDELEITESDNEEFEVNLEIDKNLYTRRFRRIKRFTNYMLKENKLLVSLSVLIVLGISLYIVYLNTGVYKKLLKTNQAFQTNEFILNVENSYYIESDYQGNILEGDSGFVVLRIQVKNRTTKAKTLNIGRFALTLNGNFYYHTSSYKEKLMDLGYSYSSENITSEFSRYILVFKVPKGNYDKKMTLKYADINGKDIKVDVTPLNLTLEKTKDIVSLTEELKFSESPLKDTSLVINSYDIQDRFKIDYKYCSNDSCIDSYEYIYPSASDNYAKALLKLNGSVSISDKIYIEPITTLYKFMKYFASVEYVVDGDEKVMSGTIKKIDPQKSNKKDEYYIEVPKEMKNATSIIIKFNVRNYIYKYRLK